MQAFALRLLVLTLLPGGLAAAAEPSEEPPEIPIGTDAFLQWERWPYLRVGVRAYMRSTFDRRGGNHRADSSHYIRQESDAHATALDELGPGVLWFVRHNHWHGSPWKYIVDGAETVVRESSTADPTNPVEGSVFEPQELFPDGLTYTWSTTRGADLSWVPIPFQKSLELAYGRTVYGTGYFIFWKLTPGIEHLSRPLQSWTEQSVPDPQVVELLAKSGTDIAPRGEGVNQFDGELSLQGWETKTLLHADAGPQMIRRLAIRVPEDAAERLADARLRIWWDGRKAPSVDARLGLFFGTGTLMRDEGQEYLVKSFPMTVQFENDECLFASYFPMPFHTEARIELANQRGEPIDGIQWEIRSTPYTDPPNHVGLFHATYRDLPKPERGRDLVLLDTREVEGGGDWCGHLVGTTYLFTRNGTLRTLEGDPRFYLDDSASPQGQATGSEEWGGGGDYWGGRRMTLPFVGKPVGLPGQTAVGELQNTHSAYRFLLSDLIPFGKNARFTLEHGGENDVHSEYETVAYWYGINSSGLTLTDEFNVGDPSDEERHDYRSADASPAETLISRHELGPDHVSVNDDGRSPLMQLFPPIADDGRRTRGASEFVLSLEPENLGVTLRRRLDLAFPNQKANVSVADAASADPEWVDVGTWYTAGGNTAVYADPRDSKENRDVRGPQRELLPPAHVPWESNRRWRDDEFLLPASVTRGRNRIRVRVEFVPVEKPLFPGRPLDEEAWTEYRYWAYSIVMPGTD